MSDNITRVFSRLKQTKKKAFVPFTVLGYPNRDSCLKSIVTLIENGATALELGLAFSDPMADGPIIENAAKSVVESRFTTDDAIDLIAQLRQNYSDIPITVMSYLNPALVYGIDRFLSKLKNAGVDGITFVDLPIEEGDEILSKAIAIGLAPIMLVSPLTSRERLVKILTYARGYLYLISRAGITGLSETYDLRIEANIAMIRSQSQLPVLIGFGISKPAHAEKFLSLGAHGVVVGSRIIELLDEAPNFKSLAAYTKTISAAVNNFSEERQSLAILS